MLRENKTLEEAKQYCRELNLRKGAYHPGYFIEERIGDKPAVIDDRPDGRRETWTFAELNRQANQLAHVLLGLGMKPGEKLVWCGQNSPGLVRAIHARHKIGLTTVPLNYRLADDADLFGMVGDVKRAIAWLKDHTATYGVDPQRIVVAGGSAGGNLALLAAYTPGCPLMTPDDIVADTTVRAAVSMLRVHRPQRPSRPLQPQ